MFKPRFGITKVISSQFSTVGRTDHYEYLAKNWEQKQSSQSVTIKIFVQVPVPPKAFFSLKRNKERTLWKATKTTT